MLKRTFLFVSLFLLLIANDAIGQERIDGSFAFQTDPAKKYGIYVPSTYVEGVPQKALIAFHPFHNVWGNSRTWCNILDDFAEANDLLMACPDGGADGQVDGAIDKAFTTALLDSLHQWYTIDPENTFVLGFSWGGRAAYTYGLTNVEKFAGFITIGVFMQGVFPVTNSMLENAVDKPFYIMHGDRDGVVNLQNGFFPIRDALTNAGALVESLILENVGHTIVFPNRDAILTEAFEWVQAKSDSLANLGSATNINEEAPVGVRHGLQQNYPNPFDQNTTLPYDVAEASYVDLAVYDILGRRVRTLVAGHELPGQHTIAWHGENDAGQPMAPGMYFARLISESATFTRAMVLSR